MLIFPERLLLRAEPTSLSPSGLWPASHSAASLIHTTRLGGVFLPILFSSSFRNGKDSLRVSSSIPARGDYLQISRSSSAGMEGRAGQQQCGLTLSSFHPETLTAPEVRASSHTAADLAHLLLYSWTLHDTAGQTCRRSAARAMKALEARAPAACRHHSHRRGIPGMCALLETTSALCVARKQSWESHSSGHMGRLERHLRAHDPIRIWCWN